MKNNNVEASKKRDNIPNRHLPLSPPQPGSVAVMIFLRLASLVLHSVVFFGSLNLLPSILSTLFGGSFSPAPSRVALHLFSVFLAVTRHIIFMLYYLNTNWTVDAAIGAGFFNIGSNSHLFSFQFHAVIQK